MRFLCEIWVVGALIYLAWEKPFSEYLPQTRKPPPTPALVPAAVTQQPPPVRPIARVALTPSGAWMWDKNHRSALDRPTSQSSHSPH